ncbi:MADS-box protein FLOWERING LOCUS C-like [Hordeum vulgare subsp. vulgare]|uniref:MADS-box domain-containing protein n=1 Tax=Hordeum vulgare subsp. vulgare TaxID=112509 RepID=A0A8I6Z4E2_HORVV|nr:MADS-box protein FLOWERING LOCUS C-like [Hordeum vulgare subsp. vulgare]
MGRKKIPLKCINNESSRHRTLETRRKNLASKAGELSILCNAKACVLVYDEGDAAPKVYSSHSEAVDMLNRYKTMPEGWFKTAVNQEDFLNKQLNKLQVEENKVRDPEIRILLHKAMVGSDLPDLKVDELASVSSRLEEILKSMGESIMKIRGQPRVLQPQAPYVPDNMDMGSSAMHHTSLPAPYVTDNVDMGSPAMYPPSPIPYAIGGNHMGFPRMYHAPSPTPYAIDNMEIGSPVMNGASSPTPQVTGSMHMGSPALYQVLPQQVGWFDTVRFGRDLDVLAHNGYNTNGQDGVGTSASASAGYSSNGHDGAGTSANTGSSDGIKSWDVGFNWQSGGVDPEESSWNLFPPI